MTNMHSVFARALFYLVLLTQGIACRRSREFESVGQLIRYEIVEKDDKGTPTVIDIEFEYDPCPGDQAQVVRGDAKFAKCMQQYTIGEYVPLRLVHYWDTRGFYTWTVTQVGDCTVDKERLLDGAFEKSQECRELKTQKRTVGFECSKKPFEQLVRVCPFLARD